VNDMSIINFKRREDYGTDWYVQILNVRNWSVLQVSVSWNEYPSWPYLQIKSGSGTMISILFWAYKFGFDIDIFSRTWNWDYMNLEEVNDDGNV
jgi:hypothetical protein